MCIHPGYYLTQQLHFMVFHIMYLPYALSRHETSFTIMTLAQCPIETSVVLLWKFMRKVLRHSLISLSKETELVMSFFSESALLKRLRDFVVEAWRDTKKYREHHSRFLRDDPCHVFPKKSPRRALSSSGGVSVLCLV